MGKTLPASLPIRAQAELELRRRLPDVPPGQRKHKSFDGYREDPARYAAEVLRVQWWVKQAEIVQSVRDRRRTAVYAGHGVGKTMVIAGAAQWHFDCFDPSITLTTAPKWESIHDLLWGEIKSQRPTSAPGRLMDLKLDAGPMHYVKGHNAENSAGFQGRHEERLLIILDEAQGIPPYIWEATNAMMSSPHCRTLAVGNPTETSGPYYDLREDPAWNVIRMSCLEHPNIAAELAGLPAPFPKAVSLVWVQEMLNRHCMRTTAPDGDAFEFAGAWYQPNDIFRSRVLGLFPKQAATSLVSEAWLTAAYEAELEWDERDVPQIGVDVARYGDDQTVLYARRGPVVTHRFSYSKQDTMETAGRVMRLAEVVAAEHGCEAKDVGLNVDDTGLGGGVTDRLREQGWRVNAVNFGGRADDVHEYYNKGAELWDRTAKTLQARNLDLGHLEPDVFRKLSAELMARRYKIQSDKTIRVESKDEVKKRVGRSPDDADALVLTFAGHAPVSKKVMAEISTPAPSKFGNKPAGSRWGRTERRGYR